MSDLKTLAQSRRSIRGYKPDPVPKEIIEEMIDIAKCAPSSLNTQPWKIHVVTGEPLENIRRESTRRILAGEKPQRDFPIKDEYEGVYRERQVGVAIQLFEAMEIERENRRKRAEWTMRGFRLFDAPVCLILSYEKSLEPAAVSQFDLGAFSYGLCLAAWERGLGTVVNSQGIIQGDIVRKYAEIPDQENIMICLALGYPDDSFPANHVRSRRVDREEFAHFVGF